MKKLSDLNRNQQINFLEHYADVQVNNMDRNDLEQIVYDSLVENLSYMSSDDLNEYFESLLSEDEIQKLIEQVE